MNEAIENLDEDAVLACADLVKRTGAREFKIGYLNDDPPHQWYAQAGYRGARITTENHSGPVEAADALSRRLLQGGTCTHCGKTIILSGNLRNRCRWSRQGDIWVRGCDK